MGTKEQLRENYEEIRHIIADAMIRAVYSHSIEGMRILIRVHHNIYQRYKMQLYFYLYDGELKK